MAGCPRAECMCVCVCVGGCVCVNFEWSHSSRPSFSPEETGSLIWPFSGAVTNLRLSLKSHSLTTAATPTGKGAIDTNMHTSTYTHMNVQIKHTHRNTHICMLKYTYTHTHIQTQHMPNNTHTQTGLTST